MSLHCSTRRSRYSATPYHMEKLRIASDWRIFVCSGACAFALRICQNLCLNSLCAVVQVERKHFAA